MASDEFAALDAAGTQKMYRRNLLKVCALRTKDGKDAYGEWIAEQMKLIHVEAISHQLRKYPTVADNCAKALRIMFNWARKHEHFSGDNPASGFTWLRPYNDQEEGFFTWEDEHLEAYMVRHPVGSRARMAFALMYYAGGRKATLSSSGRSTSRRAVASCTGPNGRARARRRSASTAPCRSVDSSKYIPNWHAPSQRPKRGRALRAQQVRPSLLLQRLRSGV